MPILLTHILLPVLTFLTLSVTHALCLNLNFFCVITVITAITLSLIKLQKLLIHSFSLNALMFHRKAIYIERRYLPLPKNPFLLFFEASARGCFEGLSLVETVADFLLSFAVSLFIGLRAGGAIEVDLMGLLSFNLVFGIGLTLATLVPPLTLDGQHW